MKKLLAFVVIAALCSFIGYQPEPKLNGSITISQQEALSFNGRIDYVKNYLKKTKLPSDETTFINDSVLAPIQGLINQRLQDTSNSKK